MHEPEIPQPSPLHLLIVDSDPVFRLGLRIWLEKFPDLQIVAEANHAAAALEAMIPHQSEPRVEVLAPAVATVESAPGPESLPGIDLVVLDLELGDAGANQGKQLCQQLKQQYPTVPILLLTAQRQISLLAELWQLGVEGYCPKGIEVRELVQILRQVGAGQKVWDPVLLELLQTHLRSRSTPTSPASSASWGRWRDRLMAAGLEEMEASLALLEAQLELPNLSPWQRAFLEGQRREIRTARWLVRRLFPAGSSAAGPSPLVDLPPTPIWPQSLSRIPSVNPVEAAALTLTATPEDLEAKFRTLKGLLLETTLTKLNNGLANQTGEPLEIDILKPEKKRELFYIVLRKLEEILDELRFSQVRPEQLREKRSQILLDLWRGTTADLFGRYTTLPRSPQSPAEAVEIVGLLLQERPLVQAEILEKIPLVVEFLEHLLFQAPMVVDNSPYPPGAPAAVYQATALLENLMLQVANAVIQPLLNRFADVEIIKQNFYDRRLISTREIERFRNSLSWKYRLRRLLLEPTEIFESQYNLLVLGDRGLKSMTIYAPRKQELQQLRGWPLAVTLALEARDAIAPPLRSTVAFLGQGIIYFLTQVVGRSIGLIGRGILQGIGSSWQEIRYQRRSQQPK